jgi:mono/diheme cytochrome c family protein
MSLLMPARLSHWLSAVLLAGLCLAPLASALAAGSAERGRTFARVNCSRCHSIDKVSPSPLAAAPPFRELPARYPVESLEEAFAEGFVTGHPSMPEFRLDPDQISDLIAFLKSFE